MQPFEHMKYIKSLLHLRPINQQNICLMVDLAMFLKYKCCHRSYTNACYLPKSSLNSDRVNTNIEFSCVQCCTIRPTRPVRTGNGTLNGRIASRTGFSFFFFPRNLCRGFKAVDDIYGQNRILPLSGTSLSSYGPSNSRT